MSKIVNIQDFSAHLFWDIDISLFDLVQYKSFFIIRVLEYGNMSDWKLIKEFYGMEAIKDATLNAQNLDAVTLSFVSVLFNIDKKEFKCYKHRQSFPNSWNS
jgi:hypothetical protein